MASTSMNALSPPPSFLATLGTPAIRLFENILLASGAANLPAPDVESSCCTAWVQKDSACLVCFYRSQPRPSY
ncbi:hypothetical protein HPB52_008296 [Rhipicephalus sanguineus]|uniref:Uncharacterized protein n=1 Tax=Rhipicephalus sanguineus TaxID=34632 RepID=A0A9D4SYH6_RHISA|nr:hypothetical protein HPB52_008296 [Rhipicephalus sanguineus]